MSSFRKRHIQKPIPGTRTSPHTGQVITSSGNPSLDVILGGGLPMGSICLIEEDKHVTHAKVLAKYFLAEGVLSKQAIFLGSLDDEPAELLRKLPQPLKDAEIEQELKAEQEEAAAALRNGSTENQNGLRIAWRYNDLPLVNSEQTSAKIGHHFNLLEQMDPLLLYYAKTTVWDDAANAPDIVIDDEHMSEDNFANGQQDTSASTNSSTDKENNEMAINIANIADNKTEETPMEIQQQQPQQDETNTAQLAQQQQQPMSDVANTTSSTDAYTSTPTSTSTSTTTSGTAAQHSGCEKLNHSQIFQNARYERLLKKLQTTLQEAKFTSTSALARKDLCRVCITSIGSPLWYDERFPEDILKFLTVLRAAIRSVTAVAFITMPMHLIAKCDPTLVPRIRNLVDFAIELESFAGSERETHPAFKEYNGLLHLRKITAINTLTAYMPETTDLAFKLRRKKFVIEKLHLPPELSDAKDAEHATPTLSCAAATNNAKATLDF